VESILGEGIPFDFAVWVVIAIVLGICEIFTAGFFIMFFALGALVAAVATLFNPTYPLQIGIFIVASLLLVFYARPLLKKTLNIQETPFKDSNVAALVGKEVLVLETLEKYQGKVKVVHTGEIWTAYLSENADVAQLEAGREGVIVKVDGAKLSVRPREEFKAPDAQPV
jgi:membrane protein implicated in regulation of membrane protease activity